MKDPIVSIHMITYNHENYISKAIEGVIGQKTKFTFELIIGEDCSSDSTKKIVLKYRDRYPDIIKVITSRSNVGAGKNSARVTSECRGKYVAFCEGDDFWHEKSKLEKQVEYMESHPECGLIYSDYDVYNPKSKTKLIKNWMKYKNFQIPTNIDISNVIDGKSGILTCTVLVRRFIFNKVIESDNILHNNKENAIGDTQLWAEIAALSKVHYIPESLATHILTEESASRSKDLRKRLNFEMSSSRVMVRLCEKHNIESKIKNKWKNLYYYSILKYALCCRNKAFAIEAKLNKPSITIRDRLLLLGIENLCAYYPLLAILKLRSYYYDPNRDWQ